MSKSKAPEPEETAPSADEAATPSGRRGLLGSRAVVIGGGVALALFAFALGFGAVALMRPAPKPVAEVEPPPPPPQPTEFKLAEFVVRGTGGGRPVGLSAVITIMLPSKASFLILQSRTPFLRETIFGILSGHLATGGDEHDEDRLRAEVLNLVNKVIASITCADLPPATRAEGCYGGQELPATEIAIGRLIRF
jgi:flagellar basal body-associated protein FliL